jgi:uncharacterized protein
MASPSPAAPAVGDGPRDLRPVAWALGGLGAAVLVQVLLAPIILAMLGASVNDKPETYSMTAQALLEVPFWATLVTWAVVYSRRRGAGPRADYRLAARPLDVPVGLAVGVFAQTVLLWLLYWPIFRFTSLSRDDVGHSACSLTQQAQRSQTAGVVLFVAVVVVMAPLVEELYFRGMLLGALERTMGPAAAVAVTAFVFALAHFQGPQFPALFLFGAIAGALRVRSDRLAPSVAAHMGFNAWTAIVLLTSLHGAGCR